MTVAASLKTTVRKDHPMPVDVLLAKKLKKCAAMQEKWRQDRDRTIVEARVAGASLREIGALVEMSHIGVRKILEKDKDNVLMMTAEAHEQFRPKKDQP